MARCGECSSPCQCEITADGLLLLANSEGEFYALTRSGRFTSTVSGTGSVVNPFTISFIDSLEYRPPAAQGVSSDLGDIGATDIDIYWDSMTYNTPTVTSGFFIAPTELSDLYITDFSFQTVGASLVFTGGIAGNFAEGHIQIALPPTFQRKYVGGHWGYPNASGTVILNMTGTFMHRTSTSGGGSGIEAVARVIYTTTGNLQLQSAKFWMCQI